MKARTLRALLTQKRLRNMTAGEFAATWNAAPTEAELSKARAERSKGARS